MSLINTGKNMDARKELMNLQKAFPDEVQLQSAMLDLNEKSFKEAEEGFRKLLQKDPGNVRVIAGLAQTYAAQNRLEEAEQLLHKQVEKFPSSDAIRQLFANTAILDGKYDLAIEQCRRLLATQPQSAQVHLALGEGL